MLRRALLLVATFAATNAGAETIVVDQAADLADADPNDGTPDVDLANPGLQVSLRSAIEHANLVVGMDRIELEVAAPLMPAALPEVTDRLELDGAIPNGRATLQQSLVLRAGGCTIEHLIIANAPADGITSHATGTVSLVDVDLIQNAGLGLRARGEVRIDGALVNGSAQVVGWFSGVPRRMQSGYLYH